VASGAVPQKPKSTEPLGEMLALYDMGVAANCPLFAVSWTFQALVTDDRFNAPTMVQEVAMVGPELDTVTLAQ